MDASYTYSGNIYKPGAGVTEFALTSTTGNEIKYLEKSHIAVAKSTDSAETWTDLARPAAWDFDSTGKKVVLKTATVAGEWIRVKRTTPYSDRYTTFQESSLLTSNQLNEGEDFSLFVDQELFDVQNMMTNTILPGVEGRITEEQAEKDPENPKWAGDKLLATVGAIERIFANLVGKGTGYPGAGNKGKHGKIRIDHDGSVPDLFFWNGELSPPAWQQVATQGQAGQQGPKGDPPGLQDPATSVSNVPNKGDNTVGDATAAVTQDGSGDLKFSFGIPVGEKGAKGDPGTGGAAATVDVGTTTTGNPGTNASVTNSGTTSAAVFDFTIPRGATGAAGPAPGLQSPAATATNVPNKDANNVGDATAKVTKNGSDELLFEFGIPVGLKGDKGDTGSGVTYKGIKDFTDAGEEPVTKINGDFYVNSTAGSGVWTGMASAAVDPGDRTIWNATQNKWDLVEAPPGAQVDLGYTAAADRGHVTNTAGANATITAVTSTNAGLMLPAQSVKLDGIDTGAEANWAEPTDDGNLYARTRAAGSADGNWQQIPTSPITGVTGGSGITVTGTTDRKVEITYGDGVEASAAGDGASLTIDLDGTTLSKSANGLKVSDTYKAPSATEADTLTTARTLWGQSFDGSANVDGDMTAVGNITFSSAQTISTNGNNDLTVNTGTANASFSGTASFADDVTIRSANAIQLNNTANDRSVKHQAAGALATNAVYTWPAVPAANRILQSASTGVLSWIDPASIGGFWSRNSGTGTLSPATATDNLSIGGNVTLSGAGSDLVFTGTDDTPTNRTITFQAPTNNAGFTANYTLTLPATDGAADEVLRTDGAGNLSWVAQTGGGATVTVIDDLSDIASPDNGDLAYCTDDGRMYVRYVESITDAAATLNVTTAGTGYAVTNGVELTGGTGEGCIVNITSVSGGALEDAGITLVSGGAGYAASDVLTVPGGNGDGRITVQTIGNSTDAQWVDSSPNANGHWTRNGGTSTLSPGNANDNVDLGTGDLSAAAGTFSGNLIADAGVFNNQLSVSRAGADESCFAIFNTSDGNPPSASNRTVQIFNTGSAWLGGTTSIGGTSAGPNIVLLSNGVLSVNRSDSVDPSAVVGRFSQNGIANAEILGGGTITLGGTLPASPNITLSANGNATFNGTRVYVGRSTDDGSGTFLQVPTSSSGGGIGVAASDGVTRNCMVFLNNNGIVGSIQMEGSTTKYNVSSDYRLKANIAPITDAASRLLKIKPSRFEFIKLPGIEVDGFIAHELAEVIPEAVSGEKDAVDDEGKPVMQGVDQSKVVPLLTAALQEALTRIEALEAEVQSLKGGN